MRTLTIGGRTVLVFRIQYREEYGYDDPREVVVFKHGRKAIVTTNRLDYVRDCLTGAKFSSWSDEVGSPDDIGGNLEIGPKTFARILDDALTYGHSAARKGEQSSLYGDERVTFEKAGKTHLKFVAPCGQMGRMTVREAEKLAAGLRTL